jgi:hypothetical protein
VHWGSHPAPGDGKKRSGINKSKKQNMKRVEHGIDFHLWDFPRNLPVIQMLKKRKRKKRDDSCICRGEPQQLLSFLGPLPLKVVEH